MKKVLAIVAIVMLVPFTAFGLEMMADTALEDVTGQAGVSIDISNVQLDFSMSYLAWGDSDGLDGSSSAGWVGIDGLKMTNIVIDQLGIGVAAITPIAGAWDNTIAASELVTAVDAAGTATVSNMNATNLSFLTIDVGDHTVLTHTFNAVAIGVPTLSIYVGAISDMNIALGDSADSLDDVMGTLAVGGMQVDLKAGTVFIMAH